MEEKYEILMKHNDLVKSKYNITLNENRLYIYILYKLQREKNGILSCEVSRASKKHRGFLVGLTYKLLEY